MEYYKKSVEAIIKDCGSDKEKGLNTNVASERLEHYGKNVLTPPEKEGLISKIIDNLKEPLILILIIASVVSLILGEFIDGIGILIAVIIATIIAVVQEGRSDKSFEALNNQSDDIMVKVIRNGKMSLIPKSEVTIGDIVHIELGNKIPADGRVINSVNLKVNESMLTGEVEPVDKASKEIIGENISLADRKNMVYSGTLVVDGRAKILITAVGDNTEFGKIACELKQNLGKQTPLQQKLGVLGKRISIVGTIAATIIFVFKLIEILRTNAILSSSEIFLKIKEAFVVSVTLIVAAVPEGLPTMVAITLAFNMQKMAKNKALVRKLIACETIGSVNVICSDKTGTLTANQMTVVDVWYGGDKYEPEGIDFKELILNYCLNSTADIQKHESGYNFLGNPTECSLLVNAFKNEFDYTSIRKKYGNPIHEIEFTSDRKMMSTSYMVDGKHLFLSKGSPEKILSICSKTMYKGSVVPFSDRLKREVEEEISNLQGQAKRVLAFAHKELIESDEEKKIENFENDMIFSGFVGIEDPLREDVADAIIKCKDAGIDVKMLTGDNITTATAIANQLGIIKSDSLVLEISDIEKMSDTELSDKLDKIVVLARSNPSAKMRMVKLLKLRNNSVVVTGDGINDAPALKTADVGVAMGIAGTEVSKEASDIVLLDDSFSTIVKSIRWGRGIYENFQRFIQFQLTVNVVAFTTAFFAELIGDIPFTPLQLLWVNIIMDGPPALSLGLEPPREDLLERKPVPRNASIVTKDMLFKIITNGLFIVISLLLILQTDFIFGPLEEGKKKTLVFSAFVLFTLWNAFNCREFGSKSVFSNIHRNKSMLIIVGLTFVLQIIITQVGGEIFKTEPLDFITWLKLLGFTFSVIVFSEAIKLCKRTFKRKA